MKAHTTRPYASTHEKGLRTPSRFPERAVRSSGTFQGGFGPSSGGRPYAEDMDRGNATWARVSTHAAQLTSGLSQRAALVIVGALASGVLWVVAVAPPAIAFALTVALAIGWCMWLDEHPERPEGHNGRRCAPPPVPTGHRAVHVLATT